MKPYEDITKPELAKALAHPLRTRILAALEGRTASPSELSTELGAPLGVVSYHVRRLQALGFLKLVKRVPKRGAVEHYYTAKSRPRVTDATWAKTPGVVKEAMIKASLDQIGGYVAVAAATGGFDAAEAQLTRNPVTVDAQGFTALARELELLTERIGKIEAEAAKRLARAERAGERGATVVLMLFESPPEAADAPKPVRRRTRAQK
jgi:DNA-binding transcriptional ArsR family regulator